MFKAIQGKLAELPGTLPQIPFLYWTGKYIKLYIWLDTIKAMPELKMYRKKVSVFAMQMNRKFAVKTLEGKMTGMPGDFLVIGVKGEKYPVKKEIFLETYEESELTKDEILKCHCGVPFKKISEYLYVPDCIHLPNLRMSVG